MFIAIIIVALLLVLAGEFFYLRSLVGRILAYWGADVSRKSIKIIKYSIIAIFLGVSAFLFTVPGLICLHIILAAGFLDLLCLLIRKIIKKNPRVIKFITASAILPIIIGVSMVIYGYINMHNVVATEYTVTTEKPLGRDYKIAFLSDMHTGVSLDMEEIKAVCDEIGARELDALLLGGDIVDESTTKEEMEQIFSLFGNIKTKYGIYFVYGNHDIPRHPDLDSGDFSAQELERAITSQGIIVLEDEVAVLGEDITLIGHRDASFRGNEEISERESIENLIKLTDKSKFSLLLDHQPREYDSCKAAGVDLIVSGHTHAGQIWPAGWVTTLIAPNDQNYGHEVDGGFNAIVSSGIAGWAFPIKTEKRAEYLIITITNN